MYIPIHTGMYCYVFYSQVNGELTVKENMADTVGFTEALKAYHQYIRENGVEPILLGFEEYNHEKLFTLAFANVRNSTF